MELFGFQINRKKIDKEQASIESFVPPTNDDGALSIAEGGVYGTYVDLDGSVSTEAQLVSKYRLISMDPIVDLAIQDIVNECIVEDVDEDTVSIVLDDLEISKGIKNKIMDEFTEVQNLLEFNRISYDIFRRWYIDGRLYYHIIIDEKKPDKGILELRYIDPRHIKKIREVKKDKNNKSGVTTEKVTNEYFMYNGGGFTNATKSYNGAQNVEGVKIAKDSILYCTSGLMDVDNKMILSHLHKAIKPLNQLKSMEDSLLIYRISRAPERRIFYVDVGGLPKAKAEQYLRDIMTRFKNKVVYDSETGEIRDNRKFMTMLEDFWLPRREGSRGTEITTLPGGQNLGETEDVVYFQNLLYRSLNVPVTRLQPESTFTLGRSTEISRDEVKFSKFITRLRKKFSETFTKLLEKQLILKKICTVDEWEDWKNDIKYKFAVDNYFDELKNLEMNRDRIAMYNDMQELVGKYYSHEYVRRFVLQQTDEEMKDIDKQIEEEKKSGKYNDPDEMEDDDTSDEGNWSQPKNEPQPDDNETQKDEEDK